MDFFEQYDREIKRRVAIWALLFTGVFMLLAYGSYHFFKDKPYIMFSVLFVSFVVITLYCGAFVIRDTLAPMKKIWEALQFVGPQSSGVKPNIASLRAGKDMVLRLTNQIYQLANVMETVAKSEKVQLRDIHASFVANSLPLPLVVLNSEDKVVFVNPAASSYFAMPANEMSGQNIYTLLDMSFPNNDQPFEAWLKSSRQTTATAARQWERVRIGLPGQGDSKQFDMAAYYNKGNSMGYETLLVFFDHTEVYAQDDQAMSFVALTVHELRTPLTLLRGYIEVFNEEIGPNLTGEMQAFMQKMDASAQQLTAFVNNILNVAKIEDNQLTLQLHEDDWTDIITSVIGDISIRARVRGITIKTDLTADLPKVGVDRYSIYEVIANLVDNAIKYSKGTHEIYISTRLDEHGLVETSVKDFGLGIDSSVLPHVFDKFYRNHRNRAQIGGTGLGLFLSRAIVEAHGGKVWVRSKVNEGSTFYFTVLPFNQLSSADKLSSEKGFVRSAHGWIKNHSLYRN